MHLSNFLLFGASLFLPCFARVAPQPPPSIRWVDCAENVPGPSTTSTLNISAIDLSNLPSTLHCGQLEVPMSNTVFFYCHLLAQLRIALLGPRRGPV